MTLATEATRPSEQAAHLFSASSLARRTSCADGEGGIIPTEDPRLSYVNPAIVARMRDRLRAQTAECVMATFGVSVNTWVKMRKGMPIRHSVAERLLRRIGADL